MILFFHSFIILNATIVDDINLFKAQIAYKENNLNKALNSYNVIENKTDSIYYNIGNILYKQKKYTQAIQMYNKISLKKLEYKKMHNLGNCYAQLNQIKKSISYYTKALKINYDKETKSNLDMLKKIKDESEEQLNEKYENETDTIARVGQNEINKYSDKDNSNNVNNNSNDLNSTDVYQIYNISNLKSKAKKEKQLKVKNVENSSKQIKISNPDLSSLEERKWNKSLNNRGIETLLVPLNLKEENNETITKPW